MEDIFNRTVVPIRSSVTSSVATSLPSDSSPGFWTRKSRSRAPSFNDRSFPKPLGLMLAGRSLAQLNKNEAVHMAYLRGLAEEITAINRLKTAGIPVANTLDVGNYHGSEAMVMEKFVEVLKPLRLDASDIEDLVDSKLANHRTLDSLIEIRNAISREKVVILDLQVGIRGSSKPNFVNLGHKPGSLAVLDPLRISPSEEGYDNEPELKVLDELIVTLRKKLNSAKLAA